LSPFSIPQTKLAYVLGPLNFAIDNAFTFPPFDLPLVLLVDDLIIGKGEIDMRPPSVRPVEDAYLFRRAAAYLLLLFFLFLSFFAARRLSPRADCYCCVKKVVDFFLRAEPISSYPTCLRVLSEEDSDRSAFPFSFLGPRALISVSFTSFRLGF